MKHSLSFFWAIFSGFLFLAPSTFSKPTTQPTTSKVLTANPTLFHVKKNKVVSIEELDISQLFSKADQAWEAKKFSIAIVLYKTITQYFPMHLSTYVASYNLALSYENTKQWDKAIASYREFIQSYEDKKDLTINALFRIASCFEEQKKWKKAFETYDLVLQKDLKPEDRLEANSYAGRSLYLSGEASKAKVFFGLAKKLFLRFKAQKKMASYPVGMAYYYLAMLSEKKFQKQGFSFPEAQLKKDLESKAKLLLATQKKYIETIQLQDLEWAQSSIFRIGKLYERMFFDMWESPTPPKLNDEEKKIYKEILLKKIINLLDKTLLLYQRSLDFSKEWKLQGKDLEKIQQSFRKIQLIYRSLKQKMLSPSSQPTSQASSRPTSQPSQVPFQKSTQGSKQIKLQP